ncbi:MAG: C-terminal binding protein [Gemmataceae bacterium]|nr:C-terminal binding protein [Gemmataceae bacterium]
MTAQRPLVVVTDYLAEAGVENSVLGSVADIRMLQTHDEDVVIQHAPEASALLVFHDIKISEKTISKLDRCLGIVRCGVGYDNVDLKAAGKRGIAVCNVPDYGSEEVADHAIMMLLAIARRLIPSVDMIRQGGWNPEVAFGAPRLRGKAVGVIGCGRIGTAMALRLKALGMRVLFYDPFATPGLDKALGIERCFTLEEMLPQTQFVSVHTPLTTHTKHILNEKTLSLLPKGSYVVNTARGPCVSADGLLKAVENGQVAFAALDVLEKEPLEDERLRHHPKIVLTPHSAYYSVEGFTEMRRKGAEEIRRMLDGKSVLNLVNGHCMENPRFKLPANPLD